VRAGMSSGGIPEGVEEVAEEEVTHDVAEAKELDPAGLLRESEDMEKVGPMTVAADAGEKSPPPLRGREGAAEMDTKLELREPPPPRNPEGSEVTAGAELLRGSLPPLVGGRGSSGDGVPPPQEMGLPDFDEEEGTAGDAGAAFCSKPFCRRDHAGGPARGGRRCSWPFAR